MREGNQCAELKSACTIGTADTPKRVRDVRRAGYSNTTVLKPGYEEVYSG
eukprot:gene31988-41170_t